MVKTPSLKTQYLAVGDGWIQAVRAKDFESLARYCQPNLTSQVVTPSRDETYHHPGELIAKYQQWFGECDPIYSLHARVDLVGERLSIDYRFQLVELGNWFTVEQQLYATLKDGRIEKLQLLCSGFQPVENQNDGKPPEPVSRSALPDARLEFDTHMANAGTTCAILTPAIKAKLRELHSGQLLEIRVNDPGAKGDIEAWSRLSGNQIVEMSAADGQALRFVLQKK